MPIAASVRFSSASDAQPDPAHALCFLISREQKGYGTPDSRVVSHPSTNEAWRSLTSLIGREAVLSAQYGRIRKDILVPASLLLLLDGTGCSFLLYFGGFPLGSMAVSERTSLCHPPYLIFA